jgi:uncharacterized protein
MSERSDYQAGVPCWVDTMCPEPQSAMRFYQELFGWEFAGPGAMPGEAAGGYFVARLRDRDVAGVGAQPVVGASPAPAWTTYVSVADVGDAVARATAAGGTVLAGPVAAPPAGRLAVLADPAGAAFGVWEPELRQGAQVVNEPSAWAMSLLQTTDPDGAKAFYRDLFGWEAEAFDIGGAEGALFRLPGYLGGEPQQPVPRDVVAAMAPTAGEASGAGSSYWSVNFWIDDADAAAAKTRALGGNVVVPPRDTPGFRNAVLADPHGAVFSVSKLVAGP